MRYGVLRVIGMVLRITGWFAMFIIVLVSFLLAVLMAAGATLTPGSTVGILSGATGAFIIFIGGLIYALIVGIPLIAIGELVFVFIDIEKNTRDTVNLLRSKEEQPVAYTG